MLPNFLIVGAPRAGTTWMAKNLREHPQVFMPKKKEIHFFDREYDRGIEYYKSFFDKATDQIAIGEGTPDYLYIKEIPELIHKYMPDAKLIFSLRNPVERLYSRYWNAKAKYIENKDLSFEQKLKKKPLFIEEGYYVDHLKRYFELFPRENILIMMYEDIATKPEQFMKEIYSFLGVDTEFKSPLLTNRINSASSKKKLSKSVSLYNVYRALMRLRLFGIAKLVEKYNTAPYPPINEDTKQWLLEDVYGKKNKQLEQLISKNLSSWNDIRY